MTNEIKNELGITDIDDGIIGLSLPMAPPLNQVNVYFLRDGDGWTMVDSGINSAEHRGILLRVFSDVLNNEPITKLIVTHYHPDHIGLAGWICREKQCELHMTPLEFLQARSLSLDTSVSFIDNMNDYYRDAGLADNMRQQIVSKGNTIAKSIAPLPIRFNGLSDRGTLFINGEKWHIIYGPGHAPAQGCLYNETRKLFITADHIVARITPNISVWPFEPHANSLQHYMDSLSAIKDIVADDVTLLPGHGKPFDDLHGRIDRLMAHHDKRITQLTDILANGALNLNDVMEKLFKSGMDARSVVFAMAETHAHLNYMIANGTATLDTSGKTPMYKAG